MTTDLSKPTDLAQLSGLSDYAWRGLEFLDADQAQLGFYPAHWVAAAVSGLTGRDGRRMYRLLLDCEGHGLVERARERPGKPWTWKITNAGRCAVIDRRCEADASARQAEHDKRAAHWAAEADRVLTLHLGLIDPELCERTGKFLAREEWLLKDGLPDKMLLLAAKAVGYTS
jgi:hypothetical protein